MGSYIEEFQDSDREKESEIIVTIDGPAASGKGTLAEYIAEILGFKHFSASDIFYEIADERGLEDHELSEEAEKEVDLEIDRRTLERGLENSCVIDGRLPSWVLGDFSDLKVRLTAEVEERARRLEEREDLEEKKAIEIVEKRDREDYRRYQEYYGIYPEKEEIYDVIIDNTNLGIEEQNRLVDKILEKVFSERID